MEEKITTPISLTRSCAIVTGANKGIGFEICRQLAGKEIMVVLTARDEKRGCEAIQKLRDSGVSEDMVVFHQLDVADPTSVVSLVHFIKTKFGKLDILINNAGISGVVVEGDAMILAELIEKHASRAFDITVENILSKGSVIETYELTQQCLEINYYGAKRMIEEFIPLLKLSDSPRIVNVSSTMGNLKVLSNEWAMSVLSDVENLTKERVDEVVNKYLKDFKEGSIKANHWPVELSAYIVSKAAMNAYTRIIAKRYSTFIINCVCPGYVKTDITENTGILSSEEGAASPVKLALLPDGGPSGLFFRSQEVFSF